jgi:hypothetical protein
VNEAGGDDRAVPRRAYYAVIAAVFLVATVVFAHWLLGSSERLVGTNSVAPESYVFVVKKGQTMCVRDLAVPARANRVRLDLTPAAGTAPRVAVSLRTTTGYSARTTQVVRIAGYNDFSIPRNLKTAGGLLCARMGGDVSVSGFSQLRATIGPEAFVDHKPQQARVSVWFLDKRKRSLLSLLPAAAGRASVFRAGFVGAWTYLVLLLLLPVLWWAGLRQLLRGRP